ncbi:hypothetical protein M514_04356 [Trichuris suis]|uniref:CCHC-type domain-containing protein n=1 Tax=Trichuris suis TaxID=68888 RepID=A0A085N4M3_9BILA|nr:hypothetical protein M514_04356 [Trichuris suis]
MNQEQIFLAQQRFAFDQFDPATEDWDLYIQRFECELALFGLRDGRETENARRTLLLSKIGKKHFCTLVNHFRPNDIHGQTYDQLKAVLQFHYGHHPCVMADRVAFSQRFRQEGETVCQFLSALRGLAGKCDFGSTLTERLRDQLVIGINNAGWRQELLRQYPDNTATLQQVEQSALVLERAQIQHQRLSEQSPESEPLAVRRLKQKPMAVATANETRRTRLLDAGKDCLQCGRRKHGSTERCTAAGKVCYECGKRNHLAVVCLVKGRAKIRDQNSRALNLLSSHSGRDSLSDSSGRSVQEISLDSISAVDLVGNKAVVPVRLNCCEVEMIYDPGATRSVVSETTWQKIGKPPLEAAQALIAYTGVPVETLGKARVKVSAFGRTRRLYVHVVKEHDVPLFGLDWCKAFGLRFPKGIKIRSTCSLSSKEGKKFDRHDEIAHVLTEQYPEVFANNAGTLVG